MSKFQPFTAKWNQDGSRRHEERCGRKLVRNWAVLKRFGLLVEQWRRCAVCLLFTSFLKDLAAWFLHIMHQKSHRNDVWLFNYELSFEEVVHRSILLSNEQEILDYLSGFWESKGSHREQISQNFTAFGPKNCLLQWRIVTIYFVLGQIWMFLDLKR